MLLEKAKTDIADPAPLWMGAPSDHDRPIRNEPHLFVFGSILLVTGTIVTGSGPHSGSDDELVADRLPFLVRDVTRIHSITAFTVLAVVLVIIRRAHQAEKFALREQAMRLMTLLVAQAVGYWQYFTGVPVQLVAVHITLASITWIQLVRLAWQVEQVPTRDRVLL